MPACAFLPFLPMMAPQLLLPGLAYTVSCAALPWDNVDEALLEHPRRWDAGSIVSFMLWLGPVSSAFDILTFAAMHFVVCPAVVGALGLVALPSGFFGLLALLMAGYLALSVAAKALYVRRHGSLL